MIDFGPHTSLILICYILVFVVLGALTLGIILNGRKQKKILQALEAQGIKRGPVKVSE